MEPIEYVRALRARWWIVALVGLMGLGAAWVTTPARRPAFQGVTSFTGTHTLILDDPTVSQARTVDLARAALMAKTGEVPRRVVEALNVDTKPALLATRISVRYDSEVRTVAITASGEDGSQTALLADTFASQLVKYLDEREQDRQKRELDVVKARMDDLQRQSTELEVQIPGMPRERQALARAQVDALVRQFGLAYERFQQLAAQGPASLGLTTLEQATAIPVVSGGFRPPDSRGGRIAIAVPLALLLGAAMVMLAKRVDTRISTKGEAERAFGLPVVAEIPRLPRSWRGARRAVAALSATSPTAEAYRTLRSSVRLMAPLRLHPPGAEAVTANGAKVKRSKGDSNGRGSADGRVILVASPGRREGRTTVVTSLAASFARTSKRVIVLDFDRLKPEVARWLGAPAVVDRSPAPVMGGPTRAEASSVPGVRVMTEWLDPGDMTEALEAGREAVTSARRQAEVVLMDTPPLLTVSDAGELVSGADAVILVCRSGRTTAESAARASELLGRLDAAVLGVVLLGVRPPRDLPRPPRVPSRVRRSEQRLLSGRVEELSGPPPAVPVAAGASEPLAVGPAGSGHLADPLTLSHTPDGPNHADPPHQPEPVGPVASADRSQEPEPVSLLSSRPSRRTSRNRVAPVVLDDRPREPKPVGLVESAGPPHEPEPVRLVESADPPHEREPDSVPSKRPLRRTSRSRAATAVLADPPEEREPVDAVDASDLPQDPEPAIAVEASDPPQEPEPLGAVEAPDRPQAPEPVGGVEASDLPQDPEPVGAVDASDRPQAPEPVDAVDSAGPPDSSDSSEGPDISDLSAGPPAPPRGRVRTRLGLSRQSRE